LNQSYAPFTGRLISNLEISVYKIRQVGEAAFDLLSGSQAGKVLASVTQAIYLVNERDELFWLAPETSPMHRRCLKVASPLLRMEAGAGFHVRDRRLVIETGQILDFGCAPVWKPPVLPEGEWAPVSRLGGLVQSAYRQLIAQKQPCGWGVLVPAILQTAGGPAEPDAAGNGFILPGKVWPTVNGILQACLAHDFCSVLQHASGLVGLGAGLTPSGDDFLGGLFFSIQLLRCAYPEITDVQNWNVSDFILHCKLQTNLISFTLMKDNSDGAALEPFHCFANALLAGRPVDQSLPFANELVAVGHSTGWDLLTGFLVGMAVTFSW
jgi:hypothetical protein